MSIEPQMSLRDVKDHLSEVVEQVSTDHGRVIITKRGRPEAVVISIDDLASLEESLDIMARPALIGQIRDSLAEIASHDVMALTKDEAIARFQRDVV